MRKQPHLPSHQNNNNNKNHKTKDLYSNNYNIIDINIINIKLIEDDNIN